MKKALEISADPGKSAHVSIEGLIPDEDEELTVTVTAHLKQNTLYAAAGYEIAFGQTTVNCWKPAEKAKGDQKEFRIIHGDVNISARGRDFFAMFSKGEGGLISLVYHGKEYITRTPKMTFFRAYTDNDRGMAAPFYNSGWLAASMGLQFVPDTFKTEETEDCLKVSLEYMALYPEEFRCRVEYVIDASGILKMQLVYPGIQKEKYMPLFGIDFKMKKENDRFRYYGLGPEENYPDRKCGAKLGVYTGTPEENMAKYLIPQECGNREGVRYLEIKDAKGRGIRLEATEEPFSCSVLPYSAYEMENAMHIEELPKKNYTWVRLLAAQSGVGGDDSWGAPIHPQYLLGAEKERKLAFQIRPL